jgi:hypothetical protein
MLLLLMMMIESVGELIDASEVREFVKISYHIRALRTNKISS